MSALHKYMALMERFSDRQIQASKFVRLYLDPFKTETEWFCRELFDALQGVFSACDELRYGPVLRTRQALTSGN